MHEIIIIIIVVVVVVIIVVLVLVVKLLQYLFFYDYNLCDEAVADAVMRGIIHTRKVSTLLYDEF